MEEKCLGSFFHCGKENNANFEYNKGQKGSFSRAECLILSWEYNNGAYMRGLWIQQDNRRPFYKLLVLSVTKDTGKRDSKEKRSTYWGRRGRRSGRGGKRISRVCGAANISTVLLFGPI